MPRKKQLMIRARIDLSTGEAEINNMAELEELIASDPLLAADALADVLRDLQNAYARAMRLLSVEAELWAGKDGEDAEFPKCDCA
ncbi:hypothetical protein [Nitratireductor aestuarii]|nr:hypothetical protein [Nitratireductor aestuarii]